MHNHHEKSRDMARSALPSKCCVKHWRRRIHHRERGRVRAALHEARSTFVDDFDDLFDVAACADDHTKHEIAFMVDERRDADKLGPLWRWTEHHLHHTPALADATYSDCLIYFQGMLSAGLVGSHAVGHIEVVLWRVGLGRIA
jgi:hypothetical protein